MNKAAKSLLAGLTLCFSIGVFAVKGQKENTINPIIEDITNLKLEENIANNKYLNSFKNASFSFERGSNCFSGSMPVNGLFEIKHAERPEVLTYMVNFDVTYIKKLELGQIKVSLLSSTNEEPIMSENIYAYPFRDKRGNVDIEFFMHDTSFFSSDFMSDGEIKDDKAYEIAKLSAHSAVSQSIMLEKDYSRTYLIDQDGDVVVNDQNQASDFVETTTGKTTPESSGIVYPVVAITTTLISTGFSVGLANILFPRPDFFVDGLTALALYEFKMAFAFIHYDHNKDLKMPHKASETSPYINNQDLLNQDNYFHDQGEDPYDFAWAKWEYGFFNLNWSGCPVFAVYNMLIDSATSNVDLATLVLLFELCNADIGFGAVGALPVDPWLSKAIASSLLGIFKYIVLGLMAVLSLIPGVGFLLFILGGLLYIVDVLVQAYICNQRDLGAVLDVLNCNYLQGDFINKPGCAFDSFTNELKIRRQGIIAYWHQLTGNNVPNVFGNAHFVYVRNDISENNEATSKYVIYNQGDTCRNVLHGNETSIILSSSAAEANGKTIDYYVIK